MKTHFIFLQTLLLGVLMSISGTALAGFATFDEPTDTISLVGDTTLSTSATYETVIRFSSISTTSSGII